MTTNTATITNTTKHNNPQRSKRIELVITPGKSLGPFRLGSSLWDTIQLLRDRPQFFPTVELKYSQKDPLRHDFIVSLPSNGIHLRYDGSLQRLKSIECFDPSKGLAFTFPIPLRFQTIYQSSSDLPMEFPDGTTPIASRVYLYTGSTHWQQATVPPLSKVIAEHNSSSSTKYGKLGRRELESIIVKPTKGATLYFPTQVSSNETTDSSREQVKTTSNTVQITLHLSTAQDILADLGKPSRIFYKEEDKMKIHSTANDLDPFTVHPTDYFFNYFHLGIDILIDGGLHVCKKIVLHGNIPGHYDFQRYKRCPFQIVFSKRDVRQANGKDGANHVLVDVESDIDDNDPVPVHIVTAEMKANTMQKRIPWTSNEVNANEQKPVILTRGSSEQNPFGSTHLTGYDEGIVMEVTKNGYVPTIVLY
ncbi:hypothetical protein CLU79DRAFT_706537 [Phycomyces nitens]|nr:hypothetical protein CLU79DRAFT_706537 [Phycomyces nitens]